MSILFSEEEWEMIRRGAMREWERMHPPGLGCPRRTKIPVTSYPNWDNNHQQHGNNMRDLQVIIIVGIKEEVSKS